MVLDIFLEELGQIFAVFFFFPSTAQCTYDNVTLINWKCVFELNISAKSYTGIVDHEV